MKEIPGFPNHKITTDGKVWSNKYKRFLKGGFSHKGYKCYCLCDGKGNQLTKNAHRLVMLTYVGPSDLQVNHKNGNKLDNRLTNLEYCTGLYNMRHAFRTGIRKGRKEADHHMAKLSLKECKTIYKEIKNRKTTLKQLANQFSLSYGTIVKISCGAHWSCKYLK